MKDSKTNVGDIMVKDIVIVPPDMSICDVMLEMRRKRITSVIVEVSKSEGKYVMVTRKDILARVLVNRGDIDKIKASDIMTYPLFSVTPDMSIKHVAKIMYRTNIRRFPVVENSHMVGIISNSDILKTICKEMD